MSGTRRTLTEIIDGWWCDNPIGAKQVASNSVPFPKSFLNAVSEINNMSPKSNHQPRFRFSNGTMEIIDSVSILKKKNSYGFWIGAENPWTV